jgi:hypothetical protein
LKNLVIFAIPKKTMDFFEVTGGFWLEEKGAEKTTPGTLASDPTPSWRGLRPGREGLLPGGN